MLRSLLRPGPFLFFTTPSLSMPDRDPDAALKKQLAQEIVDLQREFDILKDWVSTHLRLGDCSYSKYEQMVKRFSNVALTLKVKYAKMRVLQERSPSSKSSGR